MFDADKVADYIVMELGMFNAKKGPQRLPNGTKNRSKMALKNNEQRRSVFGRLLDGVHWDSAPATIRAGAVEGVRGRHKSLPLGIWIRI